MSAPLQKPAPAAPAAPAPNVVTTGALAGAPMSREDVAALRTRRSELSDQLESAAGRRRQLTEQLRRADGVNKSGLEARIGVLDQRIIRIESEIDEIGQQLASPEAVRFIAETRPPRTFGPPLRFSNVDPEPIIICFILFVMSPIALSLSRLIWKRASRTYMATPALSGESGQRLERIEQAMDAIAIEVERVSEGQRFVTRLLSERGSALGGAPGVGDQMRVPAGESGRAR